MAGDGKDGVGPPRKVIQLVKQRKPEIQSDADTMLQGAVGRFKECLVLGWSKEDDLEVWSTGALTDETQMLYIMELWKTHMLTAALGHEDE